MYVFKKGILKRGEHQIIDTVLANEIANGMKTWAVARGATHFCHWFQPLTQLTAEKHDSFIGELVVQYDCKFHIAS